MTNSTCYLAALVLLAALPGQPAIASFARSTDASMRATAEAGSGGAITTATAVGAGDRAKVARLRARAGAGQYRPTISCDTDIANAAEWTGNITILAGGACAANMRNR